MALTQTEALRERQEAAIFKLSREIDRVEARIAHKLATGEATPEQADRSRRVTVGRMRARLAFLECDFARWEARQAERVERHRG